MIENREEIIVYEEKVSPTTKTVIFVYVSCQQCGKIGWDVYLEALYIPKLCV